jgi:hypothetical protein
MSQSVKEGRLYRVFGIFAIAQNSMGEPKDGIPMRHHKAPECRRISGPGTNQQVLFLVCHERRSPGCSFCLRIRAQFTNVVHWSPSIALDTRKP